MQRGCVRDENAVGFLGIGTGTVKTAQAGFDVHHRQMREARHQRRSERAAGVALHQHRVRREARDERRQCTHRSAEQAVHTLPGVHDLQAVMHGDGERGELLAQQVRLLAGDYSLAVQLFVLCNGGQHRRELDRLRAGTEHRNDAFHADDTHRVIVIQSSPTARHPPAGTHR